MTQELWEFALTEYTFFHKLATHRAIPGHTPNVDLDLFRVVLFFYDITRIHKDSSRFVDPWRSVDKTVTVQLKDIKRERNTIAKNDMSLVMGKPVFGVCDQVRHKTACAATETS